MPIQVLFVDENDAYMQEQSALLGQKCSLLFAPSYKKALAELKSAGDCRVVVSELGLNGEDGIKFLSHVHKHYPKMRQIVLTERKEYSDVREALNTGGVFQFLEKPCPPDLLKSTILKALQLFAVELEQQWAMRNMLIGSVNALVDVLDLVNPEAIGFGKRILERVMKAGKALGVKHLWQLKLAVLLSHVGCVALPSEILEKVDSGEQLTPEEKQIFAMHPSIAAGLLSNIDQMAHIAEIIAHQRDAVTPDQPLEARIIKVALDLDRFERSGRELQAILEKMSSKNTIYDSRVVESMIDDLCPKDICSPSRECSVEELEEGMVVAKDLVNKDGVKLLLRGQTISKASLTRLKAFHVALGLMDSVHVVQNK